MQRLEGRLQCLKGRMQCCLHTLITLMGGRQHLEGRMQQQKGRGGTLTVSLADGVQVKKNHDLERQ